MLPRTPLDFLFVTFDGGGNLPPAIGMAQELVSMGHAARFLGHGAQRAAIEAAGLPFRAYRRTPDYDASVSVSPEVLAPFLFDHIIFEPLMVADVEDELRRQPADAVVVDCMLTTPIAALVSRGVPAVVLVHTLHRFFDDWQFDPIPGSPRLTALRKSRGLAPVASLQKAWLEADRVLVVSPLEFDPPAAALPANTIHVGPIGVRQHRSGWDSAWGPDTDEPLVLVSFSTTAMEQENMLNRVAEALSTLPVRVLMTTGKSIDRRVLHVGPNTTLREFVDHGLVMPYVDLVVCHAGHGTVMAALARGVPLLCLPMGRDQPMVAARVAAVGAGRTLEPDTDVASIRSAVAAILDDAGPRQYAREMAALIGRHDAATAAAEQLLEVAHSRTKTKR